MPGQFDESTATMNAWPALSLLETRVLGVLVEKEKTVPDTYPLSLNALTLGCNQKNNRDPVLTVSEGDVLGAVDGLKTHDWVIESSGARVTRYSHNVGRVLRVPEQSVNLLAALMLRGPQTAAELRAATERLHRFADTSSVEAFLDELANRSEANGGPLVVLLPRRPGEREARWAHLLSGPPPATAPMQAPAPAAAATDAWEQRLDALEADLASMRAELKELRARLDRLA
jgi:uncharacterized protein YceH (UPF0502 family)